jgi:hypothetical protein
MHVPGQYSHSNSVETPLLIPVVLYIFKDLSIVTTITLSNIYK